MKALWRFGRSIAEHVRLACLRRAGAFQPSPLTVLNRYPDIFGFVRDSLGSGEERALLSFGCSTGEEVFTLRDYFPDARIKGLDVAPENIKVAKRRLSMAPDPGLHFAVAASTKGEATESYDAIFCMAVFRHGDADRPDVMRCDPWIRFKDFARAIADVDRCLKPGGLLAISYSNFRFSDTPTATRYENIFVDRIRKRQVRVFDTDNRIIPGLVYTDVVFRKLRAAP